MVARGETSGSRGDFNGRRGPRSEPLRVFNARSINRLSLPDVSRLATACHHYRGEKVFLTVSLAGFNKVLEAFAIAAAERMSNAALQDNAIFPPAPGL
jgi:hypothetical protein